MANLKRGRKAISIKLRRIDVTKQILKDTEKIILKRITPLDHYVAVGKPKGMFGYNVAQYDWAKDISKSQSLKWVNVKTKSRNIHVFFKPRKVEIFIQRSFARDEELKALNEIGEELETYLKPYAKKPFLGFLS